MGCSQWTEMTMESRPEGTSIEKVLKEYTEHLMGIPGVIGAAIGECNGMPCIKVLAAKKGPELLNKIPPNLDGFPVVIDETGPIRALD